MSTLDNPTITSAPASIWPTVIRYGLIGGLIFIVYGLIGIITGISRPSAGFAMMGVNLVISLVLYIGLMVVAIRHYRDTENNGLVSFGKAFLIGLGVAVIVGILSSLFTYLYVTVIDPNYFQSMTQEVEDMYERLGMSEEQISLAMERVEKSMTPTTTFRNSLIYSLIFGGIVSAIVSAVMKRNPEA